MINEESYERVRVNEKDPLLNNNEVGEGVENVVDLNEEQGHSVGTKSLNSFYSIVFIINQIYGPGVLAIPIVFQEGMSVLLPLSPLFSFLYRISPYHVFLSHINDCICIFLTRTLSVNHDISSPFSAALIFFSDLVTKTVALVLMH